MHVTPVRMSPCEEHLVKQERAVVDLRIDSCNQQNNHTGRFCQAISLSTVISTLCCRPLNESAVTGLHGIFTVPAFLLIFCPAAILPRAHTCLTGLLKTEHQFFLFASM